MDRLHRQAYSPQPEIWKFRKGWVGMDNRNLMKWLFRWPTRGCWRLPKPSRVTTRGLARNEGKDHRLVPRAKVEVSPELTVEVSPELTPRGWSRNHARANSQGCSHSNLQNVCPWSPDEPPPRKRVTFNDPKVEKSPEREEANCLTEPSITDVEMWLEFQAWQLGTPTWWEELGAIPAI